MGVLSVRTFSQTFSTLPLALYYFVLFTEPFLYVDGCFGNKRKTNTRSGMVQMVVCTQNCVICSETKKNMSLDMYRPDAVENARISAQKSPIIN